MSSRANSGSSSPALDRISIDRPLVICHRGYGAVAPENTLVSFELGLDAGADLIELDYRHSQDGVPVVIHDSTFDRTTNSLEVWGRRRVRVASKTAEKIRALDAGSWFGARFAGVGVPLLTEALDFILAGGGVPLVEHKSGDAAASAKLLREGGWINRVVLMSFDWSFLREFHEIEPGQVLGALGPAVSLADGRRASRFSRNCGRGWLDELEKTGAAIVIWSRRVSRDAIRLAHSRGLRVWVYTVDHPKLAVRVCGIGVDGIITNKIARIQHALGTC